MVLYSKQLFLIMYYLNKDTDISPLHLLPGFVGKMIHTDKVSLSDFAIAAGSELPEHQHPHEQISTILEGTFDFVIGGVSRRCGPGDVAVIPGNTPHSGRAVTDCRIMDVFCPTREDYRAME